jgi:hypothetical protein
VPVEHLSHLMNWPSVGFENKIAEDGQFEAFDYGDRRCDLSPVGPVKSCAL